MEVEHEGKVEVGHDDNYDSSDEEQAPLNNTNQEEESAERRDRDESRPSRRRVSKRIVSDDDDEVDGEDDEDSDYVDGEKGEDVKQPASGVSEDLINRIDSGEAKQKSSSKQPKKKVKSKEEGPAVSQPKVNTNITEFDRVLSVLKPQKKQDLTQEEKLRTVETTINMMINAYQQDLTNRKKGEPALEKLKKLDEVESKLRDNQLMHLFVEQGVGVALRDWLRPGRRELPNERLRTRLFRVIEKMPFPDHQDLLKDSKIGKILNFYRCHPEETLENKRLTNSIIARWMDIMKNE